MRRLTLQDIMKCNGIKSFLINAIYIILSLLIYNPSWSADDFLQAGQVYGVYGTDYSYLTEHENHFYGKILVFFAKIFESLPVYTLALYILSFFALYVIVKRFFAKYDDYFAFILANLLLLTYCRDVYVYISFTKVAGIIGIAGLYIMLEDDSKKLDILEGGILFFASFLIRKAFGAVLVIVFWSATILKDCLMCYVAKTIENGKKVALKKVAHDIVVFGVVIIIIWGSSIIPQYDTPREAKIGKEDSEWSYARSLVQDYDVPEDAEDVYKKYNVNENDMFIWKSWNSDCDALSVEFANELNQKRGRAENLFEKMLSGRNVLEFFKVFPLSFLKIDCFAFLLGVFVLTFFESKAWCVKQIFGAVFSLAGMLGINYYLFINERYLRHRVDIVVILMLALIFLTFVDGTQVKNERFNRKKCGELIVLITMVFLFRLQYSADHYECPSETLLSRNKAFYENARKDDELYLLANTHLKATEKTVCFGPLDRPEIGLYNNICFEYDPATKAQYKNSGIGNPFSTICDNPKMYLIMVDWDESIKSWEEYVGKHCDKEAKAFLVKEFFGKKIYRFNSRRLEECINLSTYVGEIPNEEINAKINVNESDISVEAVLRMTDVNMFTKNVYLQIVDSDTQDYELFYTYEKESASMGAESNIMETLVSAEIEMPPFYDESDAVYILVEDGGNFYRKEITE